MLVFMVVFVVGAVAVRVLKLKSSSRGKEGGGGKRGELGMSQSSQ
jgi:hypothetical protein